MLLFVKYFFAVIVVSSVDKAALANVQYANKIHALISLLLFTSIQPDQHKSPKDH